MKVNLLQAIPIRASHVQTAYEADCAVLLYPRFKRAWMQRFLLPKGMSPYIRVRLEQHGTAVWNLIDGRRTVADIINLLTAQTTEADYPSRIATYLMQLQKDGFIRLLGNAGA